MRYIIPALLVLTLASAPSRAESASARLASSQDLGMKVSLESLLEKRLETVLRKVLGIEDVYVVANAELLADAERPDVEVLPGVTVKKVPASPAPLELPASLVKSITISVFVPRSTSDENLDLARKTAERLVGIRPERGDALNVERLGAAPQAAAASRTSALDQALRPATVLALAWLLAAGAGFMLILRRFVEPFLGILREAAQNMRRADPELSAAAPAAGLEPVVVETPAAAAPAAGADPHPQRSVPFSFIRESDMPALGMLLAELTDDDAAVVIQYLPAALASRALTALTMSKRERVLGHLSSPSLLDPAGVKRLEEDVLSKIDYIMGGEEKLATILDHASISMQTEILSSARRHDPELGRRLDRRVVRLEDLGSLDENALTVLSRGVPVRSLAVVLRFYPGLREKVLPKLKSGLGEWLAQETALIGDLSDQAKESDMQRVLKVFIQFVREGRIVLRKESPAPTPLPAPAPAPAEQPEPKVPAVGGT